MNIIIIKAKLVAAPEPPFVGTEVIIRTTPEQLTWTVYAMAFNTGVESVDAECGDGMSITLAKGEKYSHTYAKPGTYRVRVSDGIKNFVPSFRTAPEFYEGYAPMIQSVKINTPSIVAIAAGNFKNCKNMTEFDMRCCPVASISNEAFNGCTSLTSLRGLPTSATKICELSFASCRNVAGRVDLPNVTTIVPTTPDLAPFYDCPKITEVHFPASGAEAITSHPLYSISFGAENAAVYCDL